MRQFFGVFFYQTGEVQQDALAIRRAQRRPHTGLERFVRRLHGALDDFQRRVQGFAQGLPGGRVDHGNALAFGKHPLPINEAAVTTIQECSDLRQNFNVAHKSPFMQMSCSVGDPADYFCSLRKHTTAWRSSAEAMPM
ncbi:hypothetical protein D3C73_838850 [compost metagenome]